MNFKKKFLTFNVFSNLKLLLLLSFWKFWKFKKLNFPFDFVAYSNL